MKNKTLLNEIEEDTLSELVNIGMGKAAESLSEIMKSQIMEICLKILIIYKILSVKFILNVSQYFNVNGLNDCLFISKKHSIDHSQSNLGSVDHGVGSHSLY